jgi:hypothetical protein
MWVFCSGMHRSGSTVQYQIAAHLVEQAGRGERITFHKPEAFGEVREAHAAGDRLLVFKAHGLSDAIRDELRAHGGIVITAHRDIRDVVVSAMRKNNWTFRHIWRIGRLRHWTTRFEEWALVPGAMVSRYDRLSVDLPGETVRIADMLGIPLAADAACRIAAEYAADRQRERTVAVQEERQRGQAVKYDPHSLLHHNHIASGAVGGYRTVLRPAEIRAIEDACGEWMARWGYEPDRPVLGGRQRLLRWSLGRAA